MRDSRAPGKVTYSVASRVGWFVLSGIIWTAWQLAIFVAVLGVSMLAFGYGAAWLGYFFTFLWAGASPLCLLVLTRHRRRLNAYLQYSAVAFIAFESLGVVAQLVSGGELTGGFVQFFGGPPKAASAALIAGCAAIALVVWRLIVHQARGFGPGAPPLDSRPVASGPVGGVSEGSRLLVEQALPADSRQR
jgi:hypothetical protein